MTTKALLVKVELIFVVKISILVNGTSFNKVKKLRKTPNVRKCNVQIKTLDLLASLVLISFIDW